MELSAQDRVFLLKAACWAIQQRLNGAAALPPVNPSSPTVLQPAGCFVSLHARPTHALRGCIGRLDAAAPMLQAILSAAWSVLDDPRFANQRVTLPELPTLMVEISILGLLAPAPSPLAFEPLRDGIYLTIGDRSGVFLPQVARETRWPREQLLDRLCAEKLGLPARSWQQPNAKLQTFPSMILGPAGF
jgi:AmmeMemoRadiSam system protein A